MFVKRIFLELYYNIDVKFTGNLYFFYKKTLCIGIEPMTLRLTAARSNQLS